MIVLIKLILAHLLGDFVLQPSSWVAAKEAKKLKAYQLYLHLLVHGALTMLIIVDLSFWQYCAGGSMRNITANNYKTIYPRF